jgi:hypothetical protein
MLFFFFPGTRLDMRYKGDDKADGIIPLKISKATIISCYLTVVIMREKPSSPAPDTNT